MTNPQLLYRGRPVTEMSREQLIEALYETARREARAVKQYADDFRLLSEF